MGDHHKWHFFVGGPLIKRLIFCTFVYPLRYLTATYELKTSKAMNDLYTSVLFADLYGSAGEVTAYHQDGKCRLRKRSRCVFPYTENQSASLSVHRRALDAWRSLDQQTQNQWQSLAVGVEPHRPPFDHKAWISGYNLFVSAYHGFATLGDEHVPEPTPFVKFPAFRVEALGTSSQGSSLFLRLAVSLDPYAVASRYQLLAKLQLAAPGRGRKTGLMRNFLAASPCSQEPFTIEITDYRDRWSLDLQHYQVHARFVLLDRETGYRSQYLQQSFLIDL